MRGRANLRHEGPGPEGAPASSDVYTGRRFSSLNSRLPLLYLFYRKYLKTAQIYKLTFSSSMTGPLPFLLLCVRRAGWAGSSRAQGPEA